jgi:hypothetical protein
MKAKRFVIIAMVLKGVQDQTVLLQNECGKPVSSQSVTFKREVVLATAGKATLQANISTKK